MKRDDRLVPLSWDHHHGLAFALRIKRELPGASPEAVEQLYGDLLQFWTAGLLPHFRVEGECLLARLLRYVPGEHETVARTLRDHLDMAALVATMRDTGDIETRRQSLAAFGEQLADHIRWEERVLFDVTQRELDDGELTMLGGEIQEAIPSVVPAPGLEP